MWRVLLAIVAATGVSGVAAASDIRHDETLERAAARIAAERMGDLRGGFSGAGASIFVEPAGKTRPREATVPRDPRPGVWIDGLAIAVERRSPVSPDL